MLRSHRPQRVGERTLRADLSLDCMAERMIVFMQSMTWRRPLRFGARQTSRGAGDRRGARRQIAGHRGSAQRPHLTRRAHRCAWGQQGVDQLASRVRCSVFGAQSPPPSPASRERGAAGAARDFDAGRNPLPLPRSGGGLGRGRRERLAPPTSSPHSPRSPEAPCRSSADRTPPPAAAPIRRSGSKTSGGRRSPRPQISRRFRPR